MAGRQLQQAVTDVTEGTDALRVPLVSGTAKLDSNNGVKAVVVSAMPLLYIDARFY